MVMGTVVPSQSPIIPILHKANVVCPELSTSSKVPEFSKESKI